MKNYKDKYNNIKKHSIKLIILIFIILQLSCSTNHSNIKFFNEGAKQYFIDIALNTEFGSNNNVIVKRYTDVRIYILGEKPDYLMDELYRIIEELNNYTGIIKLKIVEGLSDANFIIFFGEGDYYANNIEKEAEKYIENNFGLFFVRTNTTFDIVSGSMYVDIYRTASKNAQKHLLREELTQSLGLLNDSYKYHDSIFYQGWSETTEYLEIDRDIIKILYSDGIISGMDEDDVRRVLGLAE